MKYVIGIAAILLAVASPQVLAAPASCERVRSDIKQRIISNGVTESGFTLNIVPSDQADQPDSLVVRHCANDTYKIPYARTNSGNAPANSSPAQNGHVAEPQQIIPSVRGGLLQFDMH